MRENKIHTFPDGSCLYVAERDDLGREYWMDHIGGGVCIWATAITPIQALKIAIEYEKSQVQKEKE